MNYISTPLRTSRHPDYLCFSKKRNHVDLCDLTRAEARLPCSIERDNGKDKLRKIDK